MSPVKKVNRPVKSPREIATTGEDFLEPPPPIPASDIRETITADVVVIGAGSAGLNAVLSLLRRKEKPSVLLIDKIIPCITRH